MVERNNLITIQECEEITGKTDRTIRRAIDDGKLKPKKEDDRKYFDMNEVISVLGKKPIIDEISIAVFGKVQIGKTTFVESILDPECRIHRQEIHINEGDTKITRNYIVKRKMDNENTIWKIVGCSSNMDVLFYELNKEIKKRKIAEIDKEIEKIDKEIKERNKEIEEIDEIDEEIDETISEDYKKMQKYRKEIRKEIRDKKTKIEKLKNDKAILDNYEEVELTEEEKEWILEEIISHISKEECNFLDKSKYEKIINDSKEKKDNNIDIKNILKKIGKELENDVKSFSKSDFEERDTVELAKLIKSLDIEVKMNEYISKKIGIETIKITDTRGIGDSEEALKRDVYLNACDTVLILVDNEGNPKALKERIEKMKIASAAVEGVIVDKEYHEDREAYFLEKRDKLKEENINILKETLEELKIIPKNIIEEGNDKEKDNDISISLNLNFGSFLPQYKRGSKSSKDEEYYQDYVIEILNKIALCKNRTEKLKSKLKKNFDRSIIYSDLNKKLVSKASELINGESNGLTQNTKGISFKKNINIAYDIQDGNKKWAKEEYLTHYITEAGASILKKRIYDLNEYITNLNNDKLNLDEESYNKTLEKIFFYKYFYKYLMQNRNMGKRYSYGNKVYAERLNIEYFNEALEKEVKCFFESIPKDNEREELKNKLQKELEKSSKEEKSLELNVFFYRRETSNLLKGTIDIGIENFLNDK